MAREGKNDIFRVEKQETKQPTSIAWEVPVEVVPVPSRGVIYPAGSPLHGKETLEIRAMTAKEEDILTSRALIKQGTVITHLIRSCLIDKDVDVQKMIIGDRNALMISIRITGYGSNYTASATCPACSRESSSSFDLSSLGIKRLQINPATYGQNCFEFNLPVSKRKVFFKFLTGADEEEIQITNDRKQQLMPDMVVENNVTARLEQSIISVDGITDRGEIVRFIRSMPAMDSRSLRKFMDDNQPGIDMTVDLRCQFCSETSKISLPFGSSFFWPRD
jgi:hypothetical protein